jgi:hypothetical protein
VAYDFDDTVHPFRGTDCSMVQQLIRDLEQYCTLIVFTARDTTDDKQYKYVENYLIENNIPFNYINKDFDGSEIKGFKPLYNQFLDDKTGLYSSYIILRLFLNWVRKTTN